VHPLWRLAAPEDLEWERVLVTVTRRRVCGQIDSGRASWLGSRSRFGGLQRSWSSAPDCRHFPQCHLVGEALDEDRAPQEEFVHGGGRSPSCRTSAPVGVLLAKGIRLSVVTVTGHLPPPRRWGRGCHWEACHDQGRQLQEASRRLSGATPGRLGSATPKR
jgi:hypothetical protein